MESVLVVDRAAVFQGRWPQGFHPEAAREALDAVAARGRFVPREEAERTPAWKQVIPYCIVHRGHQVLCTERLAHGSEGRLRGRLSVGLGGHVEPGDGASPAGAVYAALWRELREEVELPPNLSATPRLLGLLNDDSNQVGEVHFGLVFALELAAHETVRILESSKLRGDFQALAGPSGLWQNLPRLESWSRILLEARAVEALAFRHALTARSGSRVKTQEET